MKNLKLLLLSGLALASAVATAQNVPELINYQGQLADANGAPLAPGLHTLSFSIWDAPSPPTNNGTKVWGDQVLSNVTVLSNGWFNVSLGPTDSFSRPLSTAFTATNRYLDVTVDGTNRLVPRQQILSAPFALVASAQNLAGTVPDARLSPNVALLNATQSFTGQNFFMNSVGIGTATPQQKLEIDGGDLLVRGPSNFALNTRATLFLGDGYNQVTAQNGLGLSLSPFGTTNALVVQLGSGNVGIGTTNPGAKLHVAGLVRMGSENGTSEGPNRPGLIVRRINSTSSVAGQIVAKSVGGQMLLERDGTPGGFRIRFTAASGFPVVAGTALDRNGAPINVYRVFYGTGTNQIFTNSQAVAHFRLSFGDAGNAADMTEVVLTRWVDASYDFVSWVGTVTSTVDQ